MDILVYAQIAEEESDQFFAAFKEIHPKDNPDMDDMLHVEQVMVTVLQSIVIEGTMKIVKRTATQDAVIPTIE